jgi:hypothetical protein
MVKIVSKDIFRAAYLIFVRENLKIGQANTEKCFSVIAGRFKKWRPDRNPASF